MFDLKKNYAISRSLAAEGMVLLKNEGAVLPFKPTDRVGVVGKNALSLLSGGGGSAAVKTEYIRSLPDGLQQKAAEGKLYFYEPSLTLAENGYSLAILNELAQHIDTAIMVVQRHASEGADRTIEQPQHVKEERAMIETADIIPQLKSNAYYPTENELALFRLVEQSAIKRVVLILNIASIVDLSHFFAFPKVQAVLLPFMAGMEGGAAIADVLCGDVNPSGRLTDTVAYAIEDHPSTANFNRIVGKRLKNDFFVVQHSLYEEGINIGYRYFETYAKDRVQFPFGFGLSYTTFAFNSLSFTVDGDTMTVQVDVTNTGEVSGREVVQVYVAAPQGRLPKPALELRGYAKTRLLAAGETETVRVPFPLSSLASFDADGVTGYPAAWVMEAGNYTVYAAQDVRTLYSCGDYHLPQTTVTQQLTLRFGGQPYEEVLPPAPASWGKDRGIKLLDVAEGKASMQEFVEQLTAEELIELAIGQPAAFAGGTSGIGNLLHYGVPNAQTADGPAGMRCAVERTCFPCATLIACTWDTELQYAMGKALGEEGYAVDLDVLLAPGLNLHRNQLCGRNFEYMAEDPLISGKTAAAIVRGVQSEGLCATIKHFAANNCEFKRMGGNSRVDERTLRELYLKGFEIAIRESNPAFVMSAYNKLNGVPSSANAQLLKGVLRDEWGYEGAVMTDWRNWVPMDEEILAGNNIKMPHGYPDEIARVRGAYYNGRISIVQLQRNAMYVLGAVMKTRAFEKQDFGTRHSMTADVLYIPSVALTTLSAMSVKQGVREDGEAYLCRLIKDARAQRIRLGYCIDLPQEGEYILTGEYRTNRPEYELWFENEAGERVATASCAEAADENAWYRFTVTVPFKKGENRLSVIPADEPHTDYDFFGSYLTNPPPWDLHLAGFEVRRKKEMRE